MQSKVKTRQADQREADSPQQGGGLNRQSGANGSTAIARPDYQGGRRDDKRLRADDERRDNRAGKHRSGARGH